MVSVVRTFNMAEHIVLHHFMHELEKIPQYWLRTWLKAWLHCGWQCGFGVWLWYKSDSSSMAVGPWKSYLNSIFPHYFQGDNKIHLLDLLKWLNEIMHPECLAKTSVHRIREDLQALLKVVPCFPSLQTSHSRPPSVSFSQTPFLSELQTH